MHVIYVPGTVLINNPAMWLQVVTKQRGEYTRDETEVTFF